MSLFEDISGLTNRISNIHRSYKNHIETNATLDEMELLEKELKADPLDKEFEDFFRRDYSNLEPGDILFTHRSVYDHFGVYIGEGKVIHIGNDKIVQETNVEEFKGSLELHVIDFNKLHKIFNNQDLLTNFLGGIQQSKWNEIIQSEYHQFTPKETVERSKKFLGEKVEFLPTLNGEHFPLWCKTGVRECSQSIVRPFKIKYTKK